jgi:hypothetical protein
MNARLKPRSAPAHRARPVNAWQRYETDKAEFMRKYPGATPAEYERAMRQIARKHGL